MATNGVLNMRFFDIRSIKSTNTVVLLGKRNTGKSTVAKDILYYHRDVPVGMVICPTEGMNPTYSQFIPSILIHEEYHPRIVDQLMERQRKLKQLIMEQEMKYGYSEEDPRTFLVMDDCGADADSWARSRPIKNLFMNGRHAHVMALICMQYPMGIPPDLRANIDFVFILRENVTKNRRRIWENYAGIFKTFDLFCLVMDQCTEDYEMLVICNNVQSNNLNDCVFWYKARQHPPFRMCMDQLWIEDAKIKQKKQQQYEAARARGEDPEGLTDIGSLTQKKNMPHITVRKVY